MRRLCWESSCNYLGNGSEAEMEELTVFSNTPSNLKGISPSEVSSGHSGWRNEPECEVAQQRCRRFHPTKG